MRVYVLILFISLALLIRNAHMMGQKVVQDKIEVAWHNEDYYENPNMVIFNYNDTSDLKMLNASFTLKQDLPNIVMMHVQAYKKSSNEYHVFPLNMTADICPYLAKESPDTKKFSDHSNMRRCPIKKGFYHVSNMIMEPRKVPPYIPVGQYMAESTTYINKNTNLLITRTYANII